MIDIEQAAATLRALGWTVIPPGYSAVSSAKDALAYVAGMRDAANGLDMSEATIRLHAGEMSAQEMRAARAVLRWMKRDTLARSEHMLKHFGNIHPAEAGVIPDPVPGQVWVSPDPRIKDRTIMPRNPRYPSLVRYATLPFLDNSEVSIYKGAWRAWARKTGARPAMDVCDAPGQ